MAEALEKEWKCFEFECPLFPKCGRAVICCAVDDFFQNLTLTKEQCCAKSDKPFFIEKKAIWRP